MAFCKNCGTELYEGQKFCGNCGAPVDEKRENNGSSDQGTYYDETAKTEPINDDVFDAPVQTGKLSTGQLVWAIINTVFSICACCLPIGVLPLVFAILTSNANYEISRKYRKIALICNIIVTSLVVLSLIVEVILSIFFAEVINDMLAQYGYYEYGFYY